MTPLPRRSGGRFLEWRVGLFALGAGVWVAGLVSGNETLTGVAILILLGAVVLGFIARGR